MIIFVDDLTGETIDAYRSSDMDDTVILIRRFRDKRADIVEHVSNKEYQSRFSVRLQQIPFDEN